VLLAGCWNGRALFSFEPPFWSTLGEPGPLRVWMSVTALRHGYLPRFDVSASADPLTSLAASLAAAPYSTVVVGPLLSLQWADFVSRSAGTKFILVDAPPPAGAPPANAVFLTFDRTAAFHAAGRSAGTAAGSAAVSGGHALVGILSCEGSGLSPAESGAFAQGAAEALGGDRPQARILGPSPDPKDIRASVQQMRGEGVAVFLLGLGDRDPDGLEALRDAGGRAVVADWQSSGAFREQVLASVEEDVRGGIAKALDALRTGTPRVEGPVRLVVGKKI
jgi:hypothetical protein